MVIELPCGGDADPFDLPQRAKSFLCSKGCSHPLSEDHRALLAEVAERSCANEDIAATKKSRNRILYFLLWSAGITVLWAIDAFIKNSAMHPDSWSAGKTAWISPYSTIFQIVIILFVAIVSTVTLTRMKIRLPRSMP